MSSSSLSLEDLKRFYGELKDGEESQRKFREFIAQEKWTLSEFQLWLDEAVSKKFPKEFQDIVTFLGGKLGFTSEFGYYSPVSGKTPYDGKWANDKICIIIESKLGTWIRYDINQLGDYLDRVASELNLAQGKTFGLYVVGETEDLGPLSDQVRGNKYANRIRIISYSALLRLIEIGAKTGLKNDQVSRLLIPIDAVNVGELVDLIQMLVEEETISRETPAIEQVSDRSRRTEPTLLQISPTPRRALSSLTEGEVVICPSKPEGVNFLKEHQAWGFVRVNRNPKYFALYVSRPEGVVKYFGEVERIVEAKKSRVSKPEEYETYEEGKMVIELKAGSLKELSDPITRGARWGFTQGLWYTTLSKLIKAKTLDDTVG